MADSNSASVPTNNTSNGTQHQPPLRQIIILPHFNTQSDRTLDSIYNQLNPTLQRPSGQFFEVLLAVKDNLSDPGSYLSTHLNEYNLRQSRPSFSEKW